MTYNLTESLDTQTEAFQKQCKCMSVEMATGIIKRHEDDIEWILIDSIWFVIYQNYLLVYPRLIFYFHT